MKKILISLLFLLPALLSQSQNKINYYEYWFDNDYGAKVTSSITPVANFDLNTTISTAPLPAGLHVLNARFRDDSSHFSQVISSFFYKTPQTGVTTQNNIDAYEYWYDNDYQNKVSTSITPQQNYNLQTTASAAALPDGLHVMNIRFRDITGEWSQVLSQFFDKKQSSQSTINLITQYEYWFDNDYNNHVSQSITPTTNFQLNSAVSMTSLPTGLHVYNVRFKDTNNLWSQAVSHFVYKIDTLPVVNNLITAYRYWTDTNFSNVTMVNLPAPVANLNLNTTVNLLGTPKGACYFNIQFLDTANKWSIVQTDSFFRTPVPFANFSSTAGNLCDSGTVNFVNNSFDTELYHWDFGDGDTSVLETPSHTYTSPGVYTVTLLATDTLMYLQDDTISVGYITIDTLPTVNATASIDTLCSGQSTILTGTGSAATYTWSNSVMNNQSFVPANSQMYILTGANGNCSAQDSIYITVNPKPILALAPVSPNDTVCNGTPITMTATGATTYAWSGPQAVTNGVAFNATNSGTYTVIGNNTFGCADTLNQIIQVNSLPVVAVGSIMPNDSVCLNTMVTMNGSGASTYVWNGPQSVTNGTAFNATNGGSYTVTGTDANGCSNTASALLTVNSLPIVTVGTVTPNDTICNGTSLTLAGAGASSYSWSGPQTITNGTAFAATNSGTYTVTGTDANLCSNTATQSIVVNSLPIVTVASVNPTDTICDGTSLTLSGGGATSYAWVGPQTITDNTAFVANSSGTYVVTGTDINSCSNSDSVYIHIKPIPVFSLGNDTSICEGETLTLSQPFASALVLWSDNSTADTLDVNTAGNYSCNVTVDGCSFADSILIGVDSLPVANFGVVVSNSQITITDSSKFGQNIKYYFGDGDSSSLASPTHTYASNGGYTIQMIVSNNCGSDTLEKTTKIITGFNEATINEQLVIYPNPTSSKLFIDLKDYNRKQMYINLIDLRGGTIYKQYYQEADQLVQIDVSAISSGTYILHINLNGKDYLNRVSIIK